MRVIVTAATSQEFDPSSKNYNTSSHRHQISFRVTGVGLLKTAVSLTAIALQEKPNLIIQAGIAGTFDHQMELGKVVAVNKEFVADLGVDEDGLWKDLFDLHLQSSNEAPYENGCLQNAFLSKLNILSLPEATAITINEISTNKKRIEQFATKYKAVTESMEGAALHFVCRKFDIPFIQIRSISNYVGERDKSKWKMKEAITNLNETLSNYLDQLKHVDSI